MNRTIAIMIVSALCLLAVAAAVYWYISSSQSHISYTSSQDLYDKTIATNPVFASAIDSSNKGDYASEITQLQTALSASQKDPQQTQMILFYLAGAYTYNGDYTNAIQTLKEIAATTANAPIIRALAVEQLGTLYKNYTNATTTTTLFADEPYKDLYVATSTNLTYLNIFQYAAAIYPLPISEYNIADSYANSILNQNLNQPTSTTSEAKFNALKQKIKDSIVAGDTSLPQIQVYVYPAYLANAQTIRALVLGKLQIMGDITLGDASQAFQTAINAYAALGVPGSDAAARIRYAYFLQSAYGQSRASDIISDLAPIMQDQARSQSLSAFFKSQIGNVTTIKPQLIALSVIDPQFKTYLISLGWTSADFSTSTTTK